MQNGFNHFSLWLAEICAVWFGMKIAPRAHPFPLLFLPFSSSQLALPQPLFRASTTTQAKRSIIVVKGDLRCLQIGAAHP
jgi:hypothetical protein